MTSGHVFFHLCGYGCGIRHRNRKYVYIPSLSAISGSEYSGHALSPVESLLVRSVDAVIRKDSSVLVDSKVDGKGVERLYDTKTKNGGHASSSFKPSADRASYGFYGFIRRKFEIFHSK